MRKFNSKIGLELVLPVAFLTGFFLFNAVASSDWLGLLIISLVIIFLGYLYKSTNYILTQKCLEIKCGFFYERLINIDEIHAVREVTDIFSAPATSVRRLEIKFSNNQSIAISPKDKNRFIETLLFLNPQIKFNKNSRSRMV